MGCCARKPPFSSLLSSSHLIPIHTYARARTSQGHKKTKQAAIDTLVEKRTPKRVRPPFPFPSCPLQFTRSLYPLPLLLSLTPSFSSLLFSLIPRQAYPSPSSFCTTHRSIAGTTVPYVTLTLPPSSFRPPPCPNRHYRHHHQLPFVLLCTLFSVFWVLCFLGARC